MGIAAPNSPQTPPISAELERSGQPNGYIFTINDEVAGAATIARVELYRGADGKDRMVVLCPACGFSALGWNQRSDDLDGATIDGCHRCGNRTYEGRRFYALGFAIDGRPGLDTVLTIFFAHFLGLDPLYSTLAGGLAAAQFHTYAATDASDAVRLDLALEESP